MKVQKEAASCLALIHRQIGPGLKALALSLAKSDELKNRLQRCIENNPFDPSLSTRSWPKQSISFQNSLMCTSAQDVQRLALILPKTDLFSLLSENIVDKLVSDLLSIRISISRGKLFFNTISCVNTST